MFCGDEWGFPDCHPHTQARIVFIEWLTIRHVGVGMGKVRHEARD